MVRRRRCTCRSRHIDVARAVDDDAVGLIHPRLRRRPAVACEAALAGTGYGGDDTGARVDAADAMVVRIGEAQTAIGIEREIERIVQQRLRRSAAIARVTFFTRSGDGTDDPLRVRHRRVPPVDAGCPCHCERSEAISIPFRAAMEIAASLRSSQ
jgi:hypothetical protein